MCCLNPADICVSVIQKPGFYCKRCEYPGATSVSIADYLKMVPDENRIWDVTHNRIYTLWLIHMYYLLLLAVSTGELVALLAGQETKINSPGPVEGFSVTGQNWGPLEPSETFSGVLYASSPICWKSTGPFPCWRLEKSVLRVGLTECCPGFLTCFPKTLASSLFWCRFPFWLLGHIIRRKRFLNVNQPVQLQRTWGCSYTMRSQTD